jgi:acyl-coenzyme A thioesterase PaaI-like protein
MRFFFHIHPAYHGTGGRVTYISADWSELRLEIPHNWRTRNYVGTIFGGSLYGAVDPMFMIMLIQRLGPDYIVWDKAATIQFKKPGNCKLYACFNITDDEVQFIQEELKNTQSMDRVYRLDITDREGNIFAKVEKTIYIRKKNKIPDTLIVNATG